MFATLAQLSPLMCVLLAHCSGPIAPQDASLDTVADGAMTSDAPGGEVVDGSATTDAQDDGDGAQMPSDSPVPEQPVTVSTSRGMVVGRARDGVASWLGIPYAAAPVGARRWRAPSQPDAWVMPRDASQKGPACPQSPARDALSGQSYAISEDCLSVNVWTGAATITNALNLPVIVFIHGGGFVSGTAALDLYDGRTLAQRGAQVVVTINYRLGQLGFLAHPSLRAEQGDNTAGPGNYGFLDQQQALRWVRDEIRNFGGDPNNVTIVGESAGSLSVCLHMVAPGSRGLFHRAISESASCPFFVNQLRTMPDPRFESAETLGVSMLRALNCEAMATPELQLQCARAKTVEQVLMAEPRPAELNIRDARYQPVIDGVVIPARPWTMFQSGMFARVPYLMGTNRDEGTAFTLGRAINNEADYRAAIAQLLPLPAMQLASATDEIVTRLWPSASYPSVKDAYNDFVGDLAFVCPARAQARFVANAPMPASAYVYHFTRENQVGRNLALGVFHTAELPYVFGNFVRPFVRTAMDTAVSNTVMDAWTRFARSGDPNGPMLVPAWPAYSMANDSLYVLDTTTRVERNFRSAKCDAVDRYLAGLGQ
jgi:para-nitrobenzyl esterase